MENQKAGWGFRISLFTVSMILGTMLTVQFTANNRPRTPFAGDIIQLRSQLAYEMDNQKSLRKQIDMANEKIEEYKRSFGDQKKMVQTMEDELEKVRREAGLTEIEGHGIKIEIRDNPLFFTQLPPSTRPEDIAVRDEELISMVNTLFANGAQAVSINDNRIVTTSSIRSISPNVLQVNTHNVVSPYEIKAVGENVERMKSVMQSMYAENLRLFNAKEMVITEYRDTTLRVPAYSEPVDIRYAQVDTEGGKK
jgi:uncharacterized protein YlxW (UPF0749 family)